MIRSIFFLSIFISFDLGGSQVSSQGFSQSGSQVGSQGWWSWDGYVTYCDILIQPILLFVVDWVT